MDGWWQQLNPDIALHTYRLSCSCIHSIQHSDQYLNSHWYKRREKLRKNPNSTSKLRFIQIKCMYSQTRKCTRHISNTLPRWAWWRYCLALPYAFRLKECLPRGYRICSEDWQWHLNILQARSNRGLFYQTMILIFLLFELILITGAWYSWLILMCLIEALCIILALY